MTSLKKMSNALTRNLHIALATFLIFFSIQSFSYEMNSLLSYSEQLIEQTYKNSKISIASYNIRNYDYDDRSKVPTDKNHLAKILLSLKADLIAVQEIRNGRDFSRFLSINLPDYDLVLSKCGGSSKQKLGFIYNKSKLQPMESFEDSRLASSNQYHQHCNDGSRPAFISRFLIRPSGKQFWAMTFHLKAGGSPNSFKKRDYQFKVVSKILREFREQKYSNFVLLGDFNTTEYDKKAKRYKMFQSFLNKNSLFELTKGLTCSSYWWGGVSDGIEYPSKLDHILISKDFLNVLDVKFITSFLNSHCSVSRCQPASGRDLGRSFNRVSDHCPLSSILK